MQLFPENGWIQELKVPSESAPLNLNHKKIQLFLKKSVQWPLTPF
jgi:hypothetical protein